MTLRRLAAVLLGVALLLLVEAAVLGRSPLSVPLLALALLVIGLALLATG